MDVNACSLSMFCGLRWTIFRNWESIDDSGGDDNDDNPSVCFNILHVHFSGSAKALLPKRGGIGALIGQGTGAPPAEL